jgi:TRAP-type mannitol/chloroaromatic compound transport system permease small subunit
MITRVIERLSYAGCLLSQALAFTLMILGVVIVVLRFVRYPFIGGINLSTFFLVGVVYLVQAQVQRRNQNVAVDLFVLRTYGNTRKALTFVQLFISLAITVVITSTVWGFAWESFEARERIDGAPFYPLYPVKIAVAVSISLLLLQLIVDVLKAFKGPEKKGMESMKDIKGEEVAG